ncbi:uncharacterized protein LOC141666018 [Apium graveolens]|uniref:uncharacterized protein LOC141666018 n=1 Tax=Apium graveolens TaxID=4045 RepID=UPI003D7B7BDC
MLAVDCQGQGGGVALLWRNKNEVSIRSYSLSHIDAEVMVQGWNKFRLRRETWDLIRHLARDNNLPWVLIGDMNNVVGQRDKKGGRLYPRWLIQGFQDVLEDCELSDMELHGYPYTFERGHGTAVWTEIRLVRALFSRTWTQQFQEARLTNLEVSTSDHSPIFLEPVLEKLMVRLRIFHFENAWMCEPMYEKMVEDSWGSNQNNNLQEKLQKCASVLAEWGKDITGSFKKRITKCKQTLRATRGRVDQGSVRLYQEAITNLNEVYVQQEVFMETTVETNMVERRGP